MTDQLSLYEQVQSTLTGEMFRILGLDPQGLMRKVFGPLLWLPTDRFARLAVEFNDMVADFGMVETARRYLVRYSQGYEITDNALIPTQGPLIIASNHPGTFDLFTVLAGLPRDDVRLIISGVPVVRSLPAAEKYLIYTTADPHGRMGVVRQATQHVREGGCLLLFPTGILDPDPEIMPGASKALSLWSRSMELILRRVPEAKVQIAIVSGVLPPSSLHNPLTLLARERWKKQRLAEFGLVASHIIKQNKFNVIPKCSFSAPYNIDVLLNDENTEEATLTEAIIARACKQLEHHIRIYPSYHMDRKQLDN
jgi:hypothetical protein